MLKLRPFMRALLDGRYRDADTVVLVVGQFNTYSVVSFYEVFSPAKAKRLAVQLEVHYTPQNGP